MGLSVLTQWLKRWARLIPSHHTRARPFDPVEAIERLGVLTGAGLSLASTWEELATTDHNGDIPIQINEAIRGSENPHDAIIRITRQGEEPWRALGACWMVARASGAPMAPALHALAEALSDRARTIRQVKGALAGPRATMRLVMVLPLVGILGSALGGADPVGFYFSQALGIGLLLGGVLMLGGAWWWLRLLSHRAVPDESSLSLELDLFAIASGGGALPEAAKKTVVSALEHFDLPRANDDPTSALCALSRRAGVPIAGLARGSAARARDILRSDAEERIQRLGVAVVLPLGVLVLPAFVMVAIIPMAIGLWQGAVT
jgi:tight adherence protein B